MVENGLPWAHGSAQMDNFSNSEGSGLATIFLKPKCPSAWIQCHGNFSRSAQIHALHFTKDKARLLTADGDGWVVSWNLASERPVAVSTKDRSCTHDSSSCGCHTLALMPSSNRTSVSQGASIRY